MLATGKYQLAYREWISLQAFQKTFNEFRLRFNNKYMIQNETMESTTQQHGYAGNAEEETNLNEAVANFAQASASDRSAFTQLTDTNSQLQQKVAQVSLTNDDLQQHLAEIQNQMNMMNLVHNPEIPPVQVPAELGQVEFMILDEIHHIHVVLWCCKLLLEVIIHRGDLSHLLL